MRDKASASPPAAQSHRRVVCIVVLLCKFLITWRIGEASLQLFFFSSRRRHTRSDRDWSSDVCYSDLRDCYSLAPQAIHTLCKIELVTARHWDVRLAKFCAIIYVVTNPLSEKIPTPKDQLDAQDRLIIIRVKIERAKKHLRDLAAEILTLTHTTIVHRDPKTGVPPNPITFMWNPDFKTVPTLSFDVVAISGDIIHNLRSALDHLAHQLVFVGSPHLTTSTISRNIGFPIAESMAKYEAIKVGKVEGMRPEAKEAIDRLKPYKGGNDPLWRVHELDNIDKHRALF